VSKTREISSEADILELEHAINSSAERAVRALRTLLASAPAVVALAAVKFENIGCDPLSDRPLNLIEQVNQTFTYLATCEALRELFHRHPEATPFVINLGTAAGPDIIAKDQSIVAEVFATTHPRSNDKLRKDVMKVSNWSAAAHKYVFYSCPGERLGTMSPVKGFDDISVVSLGPCHQRSNTTTSNENRRD
jgi:hypothetical protein